MSDEEEMQRQNRKNLGDLLLVLKGKEAEIVRITRSRDVAIKEIKRLRAALDFYADEENWKPTRVDWFPTDLMSKGHADRGKTAREALSQDNELAQEAE